LSSTTCSPASPRNPALNTLDVRSRCSVPLPPYIQCSIVLSAALLHFRLAWEAALLLTSEAEFRWFANQRALAVAGHRLVRPLGPSPALPGHSLRLD
jgi:hypothetical protein